MTIHYDRQSLVRTALLLLGVWLLLSPTLAMAERRVALVIGNGAYRHVPALPNPPNDARRMAEVLRDAGFEVILGVDLDRAGMDARLREFGNRLENARLGLIFYAGHGLQVSGENWLLPVDAQLERERELEFEAMPLARIIRVAESAAPTNLVFLDACRDNPLARSLARSMGTRSAAVGAGLAEVRSGVGTLVAFATQPGNVALDGDGTRHSPFTGALARHLVTPGLDVALAMRRVREDVLEATGRRQVPWDHSSLTGDVVLVPTAMPAPSPAVPEAGADREALFWQSAMAGGSRADFEAYLQAFPNGIFAPLARSRLAALAPPAALRVPGTPPPARAYPVGVGGTFRDCPECPDLVVIPAGRFQMGTAGGDGFEGPQRDVEVAGELAIGRFHVTVGEYRRFAQATRRARADCAVFEKAAGSDSRGGAFRSRPGSGWDAPGFPQADTHPVVCVTWTDAQDYARWLSQRTGQRYRLPTEAEWEYAARAGTTTRWWWGDQPVGQCEAANGRDQTGWAGDSTAAACRDGYSRTSPVGQFRPNAFGLHDMGGNAWQWVEDCMRDNYAAAPRDASEAVTWPGCPRHIFRGGSWETAPSLLRPAQRAWGELGARYSSIGFRIVRLPSRP